MLLFTYSVLAMVGLFLIALGTGGIKPCVAAFGGDQFNDKQVGIWLTFCPGSCTFSPGSSLNSSLFFLAMQEKQRSTFFSVFYLCINGGSLLSTIITPILRGSQESNRILHSTLPWSVESNWSFLSVAVGSSGMRHPHEAGVLSSGLWCSCSADDGCSGYAWTI